MSTIRTPRTRLEPTEERPELFTHLDLPGEERPENFTHLDLPCSDGLPVENTYQPIQGWLLSGSLIPLFDEMFPEGNYYIGMDSGIYWKLMQPRLAGCRAPDWYYVPNVPRTLGGELRRSYVLWQELVSPLIAIEFVSGSGKEERDRTPYLGKFYIYERIIKAKYYAIFDPFEYVLEVYELVKGKYKPLVANASARFEIPELGIEFGHWEGTYLANPGKWLRVWDRSGKLMSSDEERAKTEKRRAETEKSRAETEKHRAETEKHRADSESSRADSESSRAEKFAAKLRELGVRPEDL